MRALKLVWACCTFTLMIAAPGMLQAEPTRFALTCIGTETSDTINFEYRWGSNDSWTQTDVSPGRWAMLTYKYDYPGKNRSPQLQIRYDDDLSSDSHYVISDLQSFAAVNRYCEAEGKRYNFHARGLELYLTGDD